VKSQFQKSVLTLPRRSYCGRLSSPSSPSPLSGRRERRRPSTSPRKRAAEAADVELSTQAEQSGKRSKSPKKKMQVQWLPSVLRKEKTSEVKGGRPRKSSRKSSRTLTTWLQAITDDRPASEIASELSVGRARSTPVPSAPGSPVAAIRSSKSVRSSRSGRSHRVLHPLPATPSSGRSWYGRGESSPTHSVSGSEEEEPISVLAVLRDHFVSSVDADGSGRLSRQELFDHIRDLLEKNRPTPLSHDYLELLSEVERCRYSEMDLGLEEEDAGLGVDEWIHFMLLRGSAPSHVAAKHLNRHLRKALSEDPELLSRLHAAFEAADKEGNGLLRQETWPEAFKAVGMSHPPEEVCLDREEDGSPWALSYYEFIGHALGLKASIVELALYDLSQGVARWVPSSLLGGHRFDGIWHTGVRVFGKEFWFGGVIMESNFDQVPFGAPVKVLRLGMTLRTYEDLVEFLKEDVYVDYNPKSYDILRRNCNHFSNELVQFLLHGKQLPEEVLMQPEWAKNAALISAARPLLNRWLGGFADEPNAESMSGGESPCTPQAVSRIDDMTEEWRSRLEAGDIVLHRQRFIDRPRPARLLSISVAPEAGRCGQKAEITYLRATAVSRWEHVSSTGTPWSWEIVCQPNVPLRQLYPLLDEADGSAHILKACLAQRDRKAREMLLRPRKTPLQPCCTKGHRLKTEERPWWLSSGSPCKICGDKEATCYEACSRCGFGICQPCIRRGGMLPGSAFADVLSPQLAKSLLEEEGWLEYKARCYFFKADHNGAGTVDKFKVRRVDSRVAAELGVKQMTDADLVKELSSFKETSDAPLELSEDSFCIFFAAALKRALKFLESGKTWKPRPRKTGRLRMLHQSSTL